MMYNAILNNKFIATKAGEITVYNYDSETREYISASTEYLAVGVGTSTAPDVIWPELPEE